MCFSPYLDIGRGGGGLPRDWYKTCLCCFSPRAAQKSKFPHLIFLTLSSPKMTIQAMQSIFQAIFVCFSPYLGNECGEGGCVHKGLVHNLLMQFFTLGS